MEINDIIRLMKAVSENGLTKFTLEEGNIKLSIRKEKEIVTLSSGPAAREIQAGDFVQPVLVASAAVAGGTKEEISSDKIVSSPLVGTFYNAASPDSDPFVKVGDPVKKGQVLGIIEAMKLMNEIESEYDGVVEAILVKNKDMVEYGQTLVSIRPL